MKKGYLVLQDGQVFEGYRFGAQQDTVGELVFNTAAVGYIEALTDPSYAGQILLQTYPLIGNVGMIHADEEAKCSLKGYVTRELCDAPSNFRTDCDLESWLREQGVPGICGVDTRQLTRVLRDKGTMNAIICDAVPADLDALQTYAIVDPVSAVTRAAAETFFAEGEEQFRVALVDCGVKNSLIRGLRKRGCTVTVYPASSGAEELLAENPHGILLSPGPGDPAENTALIETVKALLGKVPVMGIGLGHQLMALATGGKTEKLPYGHRGANQPVRDLKGTRTYITSQNHGYVVAALGSGELRFKNLNDDTCEGVDYPALKAFSVQFEPSMEPGHNDTAILFDRFAELMKGGVL